MITNIILFVFTVIAIEVVASLLNLKVFIRLHNYFNRTSKPFQMDLEVEPFIYEGATNAYNSKLDVITLTSLKTEGDYATYFHELTHKNQNRVMLELYSDLFYKVQVKSNLGLIIKGLMNLFFIPFRVAVIFILETDAFINTFRLARKHNILTKKVIMANIFAYLTYVNMVIVLGIETYLFTRFFL